jgi:hypothetical protein
MGRERHGLGADADQPVGTGAGSRLTGAARDACKERPGGASQSASCLSWVNSDHPGHVRCRSAYPLTAGLSLRCSDWSKWARSRP